MVDLPKTIEIAGKAVSRLGFGSMRFTGRGIWGEPEDRDECIAVARRAVDLGVQFIDTADSYGPHVAEEILHEALHPYPDDVLIATKAGLTRNGPDVIDTDSGPKRLGPAAWPPVGRPEYLRQQVLMSLRRLGLDQIDLLQLHRVDPQVPLADQIGELKALQDEGKIRAIGMSQCTVAQLDEARQIADIVSVQSRFNVIDRSAEDMLAVCERDGLAFIPWAPVAQGGLASAHQALADVAQAHQCSVGQVAIAWLLHLSPAMLPIPGTSRRTHLEENLAAAEVRLTPQELAQLSAAGS
ncbi:aldo/keto reductase [Mycolicibacterium grossiae]|uniref:Oxidoreductase n=1 Tax=Mycolicibacterium grossiae TaxID=1552759 RepID=A0A1E8PZ36_9MYCO|nr:aldo/keto reductase [Mycolicibacterium grossiae]OFJ51019.1 oxidoreductase [Mycolicibacterium grossiae]QEM48063.1 aldo/keto reductase [Mycolicibacterium grossiae]